MWSRAIGRAEHRLFDRSGVVAGRDREDVERVVDAVGRQHLRRRVRVRLCGSRRRKPAPGERSSPRRPGRRTRRRGRSRSPKGSARRGRQDQERQAQSARRAPKPSLSDFPALIAAAPQARRDLAGSFRHPCGESETEGRAIAAPRGVSAIVRRRTPRARRPEKRRRSRSPAASRRPRRPRRRAPIRARRTGRRSRCRGR